MALIAALSVVLWLIGPILAAPSLQEDSAEIVDIQLLDEDEEEESVFAKGDELFVEIDLRDFRESGDFDDEEARDYVLVLVIEDSDEKVIYSSNDFAGENKEVTMEPDTSEEVTFHWDVPLDIEEDSYRAVVTVRDSGDFSNVVDEEDVSFRVIASGAAIFLSPRRIDFGDVVEDETPTERVIVANTNRDAGDLKWKVTEWPDDWLELVDPPINISNPQESVTVTNTGGISLRVKATVLKGNFDDDVRIESNAGNAAISVQASVDRDAKGEITRLRVQDSSYKPGDEVTLEYRILNEGGAPIEYLVIFTARDPSNATAYNSNVQGEDATVFLEPGESSDNLTFSFMLPFGVPHGEYVITAELRNAADFESEGLETIVGEGDVFEVEKGPIISVSPSDWAFGSVRKGDNASASFDVTNTGRDILEWEVVSWPDWLELLSPTSMTRGPGTFRVEVKDSATMGAKRGVIEVVSNGGSRSINVSASVAPPPTPTVGVATVLARLSTATPSPSPTPTATPPLPTPTPFAVAPSVYNGSINTRGGVVPENAQLVVKVRDYVSPPAGIQGREFFNLVAAPPDSTYVGEPLEFLLNGMPSEPVDPPAFFFPGATRTVNIAFRGLPTPTATTAPPTPTPIPPTPTPTFTPTPARQATPTATSSPVPPTATPSPSPTRSVQSKTPTPTSVAFAEAVSTQTPPPETEPETTVTPQPSGGPCTANAEISLTSGIANILLLLVPVGVVAGARAWGRKRTNT